MIGLPEPRCYRLTKLIPIYFLGFLLPLNVFNGSPFLPPPPTLNPLGLNFPFLKLFALFSGLFSGTKPICCDVRAFLPSLGSR